jgi:hypothetical protein
MITEIIIAYLIIAGLCAAFWWGLNHQPPQCYYCGEPLERGKEEIGLAGEKCCIVCKQREYGR